MHASVQLETVRDFPRGRFRRVLFDFDGTISLLREGWQRIMAPMMAEMIAGGGEVTPEIEDEVQDLIDDTAGMNTIFQMECLSDLVRWRGRVPEDEILNARGYKAIYNERLMKPVRERLTRLERGELTVEQATVRGSLEFLRALRERGAVLYLASGTDHEDVEHEAALLGAAQFFDGGIRGAEEGPGEAHNKEEAILDILEEHQLQGAEVLVVGDGPVELENAKQHGCTALGVASDETCGEGWNWEKRERLINAGADLLVPDFREWRALTAYLFSSSD